MFSHILYHGHSCQHSTQLFSRLGRTIRQLWTTQTSRNSKEVINGELEKIKNARSQSIKQKRMEETCKAPIF